MNVTVLKPALASRKRKANTPITTIVLHATDGASAKSSIGWLKHIGLSYHYVIERDGEITKCVPTSRTAYHAGISDGPDGINVNEYSIGISFANRESDRERITQYQVDAADQLIAALIPAIPTITQLTTHYAISPGRKTDPKMMPKEEIARIARNNGLLVWGIN